MTIAHLCEWLEFEKTGRPAWFPQRAGKIGCRTSNSLPSLQPPKSQLTLEVGKNEEPQPGVKHSNATYFSTRFSRPGSRHRTDEPPGRTGGWAWAGGRETEEWQAVRASAGGQAPSLGLEGPRQAARAVRVGRAPPRSAVKPAAHGRKPRTQTPQPVSSHPLTSSPPPGLNPAKPSRREGGEWVTCPRGQGGKCGCGSGGPQIQRPLCIV